MNATYSHRSILINKAEKLEEVSYTICLEKCRNIICTLPHHFCPRCFDILHIGTNLKHDNITFNITRCPHPTCFNNLHMKCPDCYTDLHVVLSII